MIPAVNSLKEIEVTEQPSLCHHMIRETCNVVGECDGLEAVKQAVYNILNYRAVPLHYFFMELWRGIAGPHRQVDGLCHGGSGTADYRSSDTG